MTELETATTTDLITELKRRHNTVLVVGSRDAKNDDVAKEIWWDYQGDDLQLIGMLDVAKAVVRSRIVNEASAEADEDDE